MTRTRKPGISRRSTLALMGAGAMSFAAPWVARAQAKTIKIGMRPFCRVASRNSGRPRAMR
nr:hypothetical protein [Bradyrhizobium altum]